MKNTDDLYNAVAKAAYELYEKRDRVHGYHLEDWLEAEKIVMKKCQGNRQKGRRYLREEKEIIRRDETKDIKNKNRNKEDAVTTCRFFSQATMKQWRSLMIRLAVSYGLCCLGDATILPNNSFYL